jgi:capsular exopolysaccharide synthesis family protein
VENSQQNFSSIWAAARVHLFRYLGNLRKRWWVVALTISISLCGAAWFVSQLPPAYLSGGRLMVSGQIRINEGAMYTEELVNFFGTQIELMQSPEVKKRAHARVHGLRPDLAPEDVKLDVGQMPKASLFVMRATGQSPLYTQAYLDAAMEEYMLMKKEMREQKSVSTSAVIADELVRLEKEMAKEEEEMHDFQKENNIGFLHEEGNSAGVYLAGLSRQLAELKTEYDLLALLDLDQNVDRQQSADRAAKDNTSMASFGPMGDYQKAKQQVQAIKAERDSLSRYLRPKHPMMVALTDEIQKGEKLIETFRQQSVDTLKNRRESIRLQIENLTGVSKQWEEKALDLSRRIAEFDKIKSKSERTKSQYDRLLASLRSVDVTKAIPEDTIAVLEKASPAISIRPGLARIMWIGFAIGAALGLGILFIIDRLDDRIESFMEFRSIFKENLLGQIPREETKGDLALLQPDDSRHALLECFRTLRSSIIFLPVDGVRPKTLLVTSATPGEGKTTISSNLAISLAFSGAKTLLVDGDLRRGRLHEVFGVDGNAAGFSKVLQQRVPWREAIIPTHISNLHILPRGKSLAHPSEHFLSKTADQFLQETYSQFDYVIFDSAPVMAADDALSFAPKIDGTIFVLRFSASSSRLSRKALDLLTQRQVNLLGVVCNDVKLSESDYGYGYYYQYSEHSARQREAESAEETEKTGA